MLLLTRFNLQYLRDEGEEDRYGGETQEIVEDYDYESDNEESRECKVFAQDGNDIEEDEESMIEG